MKRRRGRRKDAREKRNGDISEKRSKWNERKIKTRRWSNMTNNEIKMR
jgi:hypothetical protein